MARLRSEVDMLAGVSGADSLLADKRARIQELCAKRLADKPPHVQHRELDERIEKHNKAITNLADKTIPGLEEQLSKARADLDQRREAVVQLRAQKDALLQPGIELDCRLAKYKRPRDGTILTTPQ